MHLPASGSARTIVLVHGWPGLPSDYGAVRDRLSGFRVFVPDLRGFGAGFRGGLAHDDATATAQARHVLRQADDAGATEGVIIGGYDIGSRIAQAAMRLEPARFGGAVITPAYPGIGSRAADPSLAPVFWYQHFHRERVVIELIDGKPDAVRAYLDHIWRSWSGPGVVNGPPNRDEVIAAYARPGAFAASIQWYVANRGYDGDASPLDIPTTMLWPGEDPLFPLEWADRLGDHFTRATLCPVEGVGHFIPSEVPEELSRAVTSLADAAPR
ncbi:MAG: alpha/beta fold hydrolase [Cellulomonadaceae bacterium]